MEKQYLEASIVNEGNTARLKACMERAAAGDKLVIGYLGGSITMGSLAAVQENCYAYLSHLWWKDTFTQAEIGFVNAGIGATTSQFGVARVEEDLMVYQPDVVFIEFTVNDDSNVHFQETYEGLVRKVYGHKTAPAVITLQNAFYHDGICAEEIHTPVAKYYDLPCVSFKKAIVEQVMDGKITESDITPDHLHPNDAGHALLAEVVKYYLRQVYTQWQQERGQKEELQEKKCETAEASESTEITKNAESINKTPLTKNRYENSIRLRNRNLELQANYGFVPDTSVQEHITHIFKNGWEAKKEGAFLEFEVEAACLAIQYRRTMQHPAPSMKVVVDSREAGILNGEFDETWGDLIALETIFEEDKKAKHRVRLELVNVHENDKLPFYLVAVLVS